MDGSGMVANTIVQKMPIIGDYYRDVYETPPEDNVRHDPST